MRKNLKKALSSILSLVLIFQMTSVSALADLPLGSSNIDELPLGSSNMELPLELIKPAEKLKIDFILPLDEDIEKQTIFIGETKDNLVLPKILYAKSHEKNVEIKVLDWVGDFDTTKEGTFILNPVISEEYKNSIDKSILLPSITVTVEKPILTVNGEINLTEGFVYFTTDVDTVSYRLNADVLNKRGKYYDILSQEEQNIYNNLNSKIKASNFGEIVSDYMPYPYDVTVENGQIKDNELNLFVRNIAYAFRLDHPEIFWLSGAYSLSITGTPRGNKYTNVKVQVKLFSHKKTIGNSMAEDNENIQNEINTIINSVRNLSDYKKVYEFNKWLTSNNKYNSEVADNSASGPNNATFAEIPWSIQSAFLSKTNKQNYETARKGPVCEGYAKAMKVLCDRVNIPCILASGQSHMWNYIKLDGEWYGMDSTWSDAIFSTSGGWSDGKIVPNAIVEGDTVKNEDSNGVKSWILEGQPNFEKENRHQREDESSRLIIAQTDYKPSEQITVDSANKKIYANGKAIEILAGTNNKTKIKYDNTFVEFNGSNEQDLSEYTIYGGSKTSNVSQSNITMRSGNVKGIVAGGEGKTVDTANIYVLGGTVATVKDTDSQTSNAIILSGKVTGFDNLLTKEGSKFTVKGNAVIPVGIEITVGKTETFDLNSPNTLTVNGTLNNNGTFKFSKNNVKGTGNLTGNGRNILVKSHLQSELPNIQNQQYTGQVIQPLGLQYTFKDTVLNKEINTVLNVEYIPNNPKEVGAYTVKLTNTDSELDFTLQFNISRVGTIFEGGITTNNKNPKYGESFTLSVTPNLNKTENTIMVANDFSTQRNNTVAAYIGEKRISEEIPANIGQRATITIDTNEKHLQPGENIISVKYKGNGNISDYSENVTITLGSAVLTWNEGVVENKEYDGTTSAKIKKAPTLNGVKNNDKVEVKIGKVKFVDANSGIGKQVTATEFSITGDDSKYYTVKGQPTFAKANISKSKPTLAINNTFSGKEYDGLTAKPTVEQMTIKGTSYSDVKFRYYSDNNGKKGDLLLTEPVNVGVYWIEAFVDSTTNFEAATSNVSKFEIIKANMSGTLTITGDARYNNKLTADISDMKPAVEDDKLSFKYQWKRNGKNIDMATNSTYTIVAEDIGKNITVVVTSNNYKDIVSTGVVPTKAIPKYTVPTKTAVYGNTLENVVFEKVNEDTNNVDGVWIWQNVKQNVGDVGTHTFMATFVPDKVNNIDVYETVKNVKVTVTVNKASAPKIVFPQNSSVITYGDPLSLSIIDLTGASTEYGVFMWTNQNQYPTVINNGYEITFVPNENTIKNYETILDKTKTIPVKVEKGRTELHISLEKITGTEPNRIATIKVDISKVGQGLNPTGKVKFKNGQEELATVDIVNSTAKFEWQGLNQQDYTVTAEYLGDSNYTKLSKDFAFSAKKQNQAEFILEEIGAKTYGDSIFELTSKGGSGTGKVTYMSSDPTIISINGSKATILKSGTVTITAIKASDDTYNEASSFKTVIVNKKDVTVKANDIVVYDTDSIKPQLDKNRDILYTGFLNNTDKLDFISKINVNYANGTIFANTDIVLNMTAVSDKYNPTLINGKFTVIVPTNKVPTAPSIDVNKNEPSIGIPKDTELSAPNDETILVIYDNISSLDQKNADEKIEQISDKNKKDILKSNNKGYEISLRKKSDNSIVTVNKGNINLFIPYPNGTNSSYQFVLMHIKNDNTVEYPKINKLNKGIEFTVDSLSPFVLGWKYVKTNNSSYTENIKPDTTYVESDKIIDLIKNSEINSVIKVDVTDKFNFSYDLLDTIKDYNTKLIVKYNGKSYEILQSVVDKMPSDYIRINIKDYIKYIGAYSENTKTNDTEKINIEEKPQSTPESKSEDTLPESKSESQSVSESSEPKSESKANSNESSVPNSVSESASTATQNANTNSSNNGIIIGIVVLILVILGITVILFFKKKKD